MENISKIINVKKLSYYTYIHDQNKFKCNDTVFKSTIHQVRELIEIVETLDINEIEYKIDEHDNVLLV